MSIFVELAFRATVKTDYRLLSRRLVKETGLGVGMDMLSTTLLPYLDLDPKDGHICVSLYDSPRTNAAMCLGSEGDWSPDADIELPWQFEKRVRIIIDTATLIKAAVGSSFCAIGISDGGYYHEVRPVPFASLKAKMIEDGLREGFSGNVYTVS